VRYSLDTSVFIEAWVRHYPMDVFPAVWSNLEEGLKRGKLLAVTEVYREIEQQNDELFAWIKRLKSRFTQIEKPIQLRARNILSRFPTLAKPESTRRNADPFVIGLAAAEGLTVVTYEPAKPTRPRIPDVCQQLHIPCIALVEMFRKEGWTF
jgi:Domain of unknown function (DUF4411)